MDGAMRLGGSQARTRSRACQRGFIFQALRLFHGGMTGEHLVFVLGRETIDRQKILDALHHRAP